MLQRAHRSHGRLPRGGGAAGDSLLPVEKIYIRSDSGVKRF